MFKNILSYKSLFIAVIFVIILIRIPALGLRTIHIDEGMGIRASELVLSNQWHYSPKNGHGPTLFYIGAAIKSIANTNILVFRTVSALFLLLGLFILWLMYRNELKDIGILLILLGLGLSSGMIFFGNYFIHESLFIFLTILSLALIERFLKTKNSILLTPFIISLSLMYMTKETALFTYAAWAIAGVSILFLNNNFKSFKKLISIKNILFIISGFVLSAVLYFLFFGLNLDLIKAPYIWLTERGTNMHIRPWYYFIALLFLHESFLLISGGATAIFLTIKKQWQSRQLFFFLWFLAVLIIYSAIPYKTPWLILNIILPLGLFVAFSFSEIYKKINKIIIISFFIFLFLISLVCVYRDNFLHPNRAENYDYAYLQSGSGLLEFQNIIKGISLLDQSEPLSLQIVGYGDELLYVLTEEYNRIYEPFMPGLPVYINYKHNSEKMKKTLSETGYKYVLLKFTYFTPGPEIDLFIRQDKWDAYKHSSDFINPQTVSPDGTMRYD